MKFFLLSFLTIFVFSSLAYADVGVSNLMPDKYQVKKVAVDEKYYVDRDYTIISLPKELEGTTLIMTGNNDKNSQGPGFISFDIDQTAIVYIGHDSRGESAKGGVPPEWLSNDFTFVEGWVVEVTDANMGTFNIWKKEMPAGNVQLGGNADPPAAGQGSMYIVLLVPLKLSTVKPIGKLTSTWASIKI